jgi:glycerol-3-phosphate dehydrogenase
LPGKKLPENVRAVTDLVQTCQDADILIFVVPHQFVHRICDQLKGKLKAGAIAISLIKVKFNFRTKILDHSFDVCLFYKSKLQNFSNV